MNRDKRAALYERMYFNELERREKISARLTLPFGVLVAIVGLLSYLINSPTKPDDGPWGWVFWGAIVCSALALFAGAWFFRRSWFGHTDKLVATAGHLEEYHRKLTEKYSPYEGGDELVASYFDDLLFNDFVVCSSENAINNDGRSYNLYRATASLTLAALLAFFGAGVLLIGNHVNGAGQHEQTEAARPTAAATATAANAECQRTHAEAAAAAPAQ